MQADTVRPKTARSRLPPQTTLPPSLLGNFPTCGQRTWRMRQPRLWRNRTSSRKRSPMPSLHLQTDAARAVVTSTSQLLRCSCRHPCVSEVALAREHSAYRHADVPPAAAVTCVEPPSPRVPASRGAIKRGASCVMPHVVCPCVCLAERRSEGAGRQRCPRTQSRRSSDACPWSYMRETAGVTSNDSIIRVKRW